MKKILIVDISFPNIPLEAKDGAKLRGFFGNYFKEHSSLLHNHFENRLLYRYPLVQYKVINGIAHLIGIEDGGELLTSLFNKITFLTIDDKKYFIRNVKIKATKKEIRETTKTITYSFQTLWLPLNQKNFSLYVKNDKEAKKILLNKILIGNILSFCKGINYSITLHLKSEIFVKQHYTYLKGNKMIAFYGYFKVNFILPSLIGLGKSVSRGFGTIIEKK